MNREIARAIHHDPFTPVLFTSDSLNVSEEQKQYLWEILETACSDSRFAEKAFNSIVILLTVGSTLKPEVTSLNPPTAALGSESFTLHVSGKNFTPDSKVVWNGGLENTVYVSNSELTTGVNMGTAEVAVQIPVSVQNGNGVLSNTVLFDLTPAAPSTSSVGPNLNPNLNPNITKK